MTKPKLIGYITPNSVKQLEDYLNGEGSRNIHIRGAQWDRCTVPIYTMPPEPAMSNEAIKPWSLRAKEQLGDDFARFNCTSYMGAEIAELREALRRTAQGGRR